MSEDGRPETQSFWKTLPGVLTAGAALIASIGGLITALYSAGLLGPSKPPAPTGSSAAVSALSKDSSATTGSPVSVATPQKETTPTPPTQREPTVTPRPAAPTSPRVATTPSESRGGERRSDAVRLNPTNGSVDDFVGVWKGTAIAVNNRYNKIILGIDFLSFLDTEDPSAIKVTITKSSDRTAVVRVYTACLQGRLGVSGCHANDKIREAALEPSTTIAPRFGLSAEAPTGKRAQLVLGQGSGDHSA